MLRTYAAQIEALAKLRGGVAFVDTAPTTIGSGAPLFAAVEFIGVAVR